MRRESGDRPRASTLRTFRAGYAAASRTRGRPRERLAVRLYARGLVNAQLAAGITPPVDVDET